MEERTTHLRAVRLHPRYAGSEKQPDAGSETTRRVRDESQRGWRGQPLGSASFLGHVCSSLKDCRRRRDGRPYETRDARWPSSPKEPEYGKFAISQLISRGSQRRAGGNRTSGDGHCANRQARRQQELEARGTERERERERVRDKETETGCPWVNVRTQ